MTIHIDTTDAPRVWRTVGPDMRVKVICQDWLAEQRAKQDEDRKARLAAGRRAKRAAGRVRKMREDQRRIRRMLGFTPSQRPLLILNRICSAMGVSVADVELGIKGRDVSEARMAACYWTRRLTSMPYAQIAYTFGLTDHTTVIHAVRTYPARRAKQGRTLRAI